MTYRMLPIWYSLPKSAVAPTSTHPMSPNTNIAKRILWFRFCQLPILLKWRMTDRKQANEILSLCWGEQQLPTWFVFDSFKLRWAASAKANTCGSKVPSFWPWYLNTCSCGIAKWKWKWLNQCSIQYVRKFNQMTLVWARYDLKELGNRQRTTKSISLTRIYYLTEDINNKRPAWIPSN